MTVLHTAKPKSVFGYTTELCRVSFFVSFSFGQSQSHPFHFINVRSHEARWKNMFCLVRCCVAKKSICLELVGCCVNTKVVVKCRGVFFKLIYTKIKQKLWIFHAEDCVWIFFANKNGNDCRNQINKQKIWNCATERRIFLTITKVNKMGRTEQKQEVDK